MRHVRPKEITDFVCEDVLAVLRGSALPRSWSSLAAQLLGVDRSAVRMADVRGVRICVRQLEAEGLVREISGEGRIMGYRTPSTLLFTAV